MSRKPNILWICTDQQRWDTLGCTGNPYVRTPNIDRLAREGVQMDRMYAQSPVCAPSRASFLTGRYPRTCRVRQNGQNIPEDELLISKHLSNHGYVCGLAGKLHLSACHPSVCPETERRIDDGYSFFSWSHAPAGRGKGNASGNAYAQWLTEQNQEYRTEPLPECRFVQTGMPAHYSQTAWCFREAKRFIEQQPQEQPWFFSLNCFDPHHAFDPPKEYLDRYRAFIDDIPLPDYLEGELEHKPIFQDIDHTAVRNQVAKFPYDEMSARDHRFLRAAYWAMIDQIDDQVGKLMEFLKETGMDENTLIIFTSDHGESLGDHGIYLKGPYCYESAVHVPLIVRWPGHALGGVKRSALAELVDVAPTLCEAAGISIPVSFQGKSFLSLLTNAEAEDVHRGSVYAEFYNSNVNHRNPKAFLTMVSDGQTKLIKVHRAPGETHIEGEMYDLVRDPHEHHNLFNRPESASLQLSMMNMLADRMAQTVDPLPQRLAFW